MTRRSVRGPLRHGACSSSGTSAPSRRFAARAGSWTSAAGSKHGGAAPRWRAVVTGSARLAAYLAGPDVFLPDAAAQAGHLPSACPDRAILLLVLERLPRFVI
jgi:hypothetical protein